MDMTKLMVAFGDFAKTPKNIKQITPSKSHKPPALCEKHCYKVLGWMLIRTT
jgi:hypothetical protein